MCVKAETLYQVANWCIGITLDKGHLNIIRYTMLLFIVYKGQLNT